MPTTGMVQWTLSEIVTLNDRRHFTLGRGVSQKNLMYNDWSEILTLARVPVSTRDPKAAPAVNRLTACGTASGWRMEVNR